MLRLQLPGLHMIYLSTIFRTVFRHRRSMQATVYVFTFYTASVLFLQRTSGKTVERPHGNRTVIVQSPPPLIEIAWISHGACVASVRRSCGDRTVGMRSSLIFGHSSTKHARHLIFD